MLVLGLLRFLCFDAHLWNKWQITRLIFPFFFHYFLWAVNDDAAPYTTLHFIKVNWQSWKLLYLKMLIKKLSCNAPKFLIQQYFKNNHLGYIHKWRHKIGFPSPSVHTNAIWLVPWGHRMPKPILTWHQLWLSTKTSYKAKKLDTR